MKTQGVTNFVKAIQKGAVKHSPELLTAIGIVGMGVTTIMSVKATPKALKQIEEARDEKGEDLTKIETVKAGWKPYIPAAITGVTSIICLLGANSIHTRRNAALVTAYQISTTALNEYKDKVVETVGEATAKEIRDRVVEEKKENIANSHPTFIIATDDDVLMYEPLSNQEFKSTTNKVEKAAIDLNWRLTSGSEFCISLNEFLRELGLKDSAVGDDVGWTDGSLIDFTFDLDMNDAGKPRLTLAYLTPPEHGYRDYYK